MYNVCSDVTTVFHLLTSTVNFSKSIRHSITSLSVFLTILVQHPNSEISWKNAAASRLVGSLESVLMHLLFFHIGTYHVLLILMASTNES